MLKDIDLYLDAEGKLKAKAPKGAITAQIAGQIKDNKEALVAYLQQLDEMTVATPASGDISALNRCGQTVPVSFAQQRLWFIDSLQNGTPEYNMPLAFEVQGQLDIKVIDRVFQTIVSRHEVLRSVYLERDGQTLQHIRAMDDIEFKVKLIDVSHLTGETLEEKVKAVVEQEMTKPFDLAQDLMLRVCYIKRRSDSGVMLLNMHHIASDGWSMDVLTQEFITLYGCYQQGMDSPLPPLAIQYADYAQWQRDHLEGAVLEGQLSYWQQQLEALPVVHGLALDHPRPAIKQHQGAVVSGTLAGVQAQSLLALAKTHKLTPFMLLHGALSLLLSRHTNRHDIVIGTPVANRTQAQIEPLIGFFVNTLVLRVDTLKATLADYFAHVRQVHLDAQSNQDVPFEQLVERLKAPRSSAHAPLFQIMITTNTDYGLGEDGQNGGFKLPGMSIAAYQSDVVQAKFDLKVDMSISEQGVGLLWTYDVNLFNQAHIEQLNDHMQCLLGALASAANANLAPQQLPMMSDSEVALLLQQSSPSIQSAPQDCCLHELFERQVKAEADKVALVYDDIALSYGELNQRANQLAHYLRSQHQITPDTLVGLWLDRSHEMVIGLLAIMKAGGAYVPLDPAHPPQRLMHILTDAELKVVLTTSALAQSMGESLSEYQGQFVALDGLGTDATHDFSEYPQTDISRDSSGVTPECLAYVIYTSGSTGMPKGVLTEHRNVVNFGHGFAAQLQLCHNPIENGWLWLSSFFFDASLKGIYLMATGTKLIVPKPQQAKDPQAIVALIAQHNIGIVNTTPQLLALIVKVAGVPKIDLISSGEAIDSANFALFKQFSHNAKTRFINAYGPTETTVNSCFADLTHADKVTIGQAVANTHLYILGAQGQLMPHGAVGELYIGGAGVARGYLNRPELNQTHFIANPFAKGDQQNARLYKSGDLVRFDSDGNIEFIGRSDAQVKIRGFRIELGEVEVQLANLAGVDSAVVVAKALAGAPQLVGYVKPTTAVKPAQISDYIGEVKTALAQTLPNYMVPDVIMLIDNWPLTRSGKIDKKQLPEPDANILQGQFVAPSNDIEQALADIWGGLLHIDPTVISATANFFDLGGHSLLCIRLVSDIRAKLSVELSIAEVFDNAVLQQLAEQIAQSAQRVARAPLSKVARDSDILPVSFAQQRLWFIDNLQGGSAQYNMPMVLEVAGQLDLAVVSKVFATIIERHEVLRTVYLEQDGQTFQRIRPFDDIDFSLGRFDLSALSGQSQQDEVQRLVSEQMVAPFDLATDLMLRVSYIAQGRDRGVMILNMHHIACDGWSMEILTQEFFALYQAYAQGHSHSLPPLAVQYGDFAHWQRHHLAGEVLDAQLSYWAQQLDELPAVHRLPLDYPRPAVKQHQGAVVNGVLDGDIAKSLLNIAKAHRLTPFMLLHGAFSLLLARHCNSHDVVVGTPVANRLQAELEPLIGFFVNTLVLRVNTEQQDLGQYLSHVRAVHLAAQSHQDVPFEQLVERLKVPRSANYSPLFQIMLTTNTDYGLNTGDAGLNLPGVSLAPYRSNVVQAKFDMNVDLSISEQGVGLSWTYDVSLFSQQHIEQLNEHMCTLLSALAQSQGAADQSLLTLPLLSDNDVSHLLDELNHTTKDYPKDKCIHQLFEQQAEQYPDNIAVSIQSESISYRQLNAKANQLAHYLRANHQVTPDTLIGICAERSIEMMVGLLAILKSGAAYVPLDPSYPQDRLSYMLEDAALDVVLSKAQVQNVLGDYQGAIVSLDDIAQNNHPYERYSAENLSLGELGLHVGHLAYVIYTSGSTGRPKGVMIEHQGLTNTIVDTATRFAVNHQSVFYQATSIGFDAATWVIFMTLSHGGELVLCADSDYQRELSQIERLTHLMMTPSMLSLVEPLGFAALQYVIVGGEACDRHLADKWKDKVRFINAYGPTEITICSSMTQLVGDDHISIGGPNANVQYLVLDSAKRLVPKGSMGELYIGGDSLARGYLNQTELSAERFIDNPYYDPAMANSSAKLYASGDLVRLLPNGKVEFVGRIDDQVKIRGFRIELGEVETQLGLLPQVDSALVMAKTLAGSDQLVGYVKPADALTDEQYPEYIAAVKQTLAHTLPEYMVPSVIMVVARWPITPNGKIDKRALPEPDSSALNVTYVAPRNDIELGLTEIWGKLFNQAPETISIYANFFELGGHSLLSIRLVSEIRTGFNTELAIQSIFDSPTIEALAEQISQNSEQSERPALQAGIREGDTAALSFAQQRLWFIDNLQGGSAEYNMPLVLSVEGALDIALLTQVFTTIITRHEVLRTVYIERDGQTLQHIRPVDELDFTITEHDLTALEGEGLTQQSKALVKAEMLGAFDLSADLMLRVSYLRQGDARGVLLINMHHIASDGWSLDVLLKELYQLYLAYSQGQPDPLKPLPVQYADYAMWQREHLSGEVLQTQLDYWAQQLDELPVVHSLPLSYPRPPVKQHQGANIKGELSATTAQSLLSLAKAHKLTPFMLLHGALSLLLSKHSNSHDIVIGTPVANRLQSELEPLIGFFVNTMVLRVNTEQPSLDDYFGHVRAVHLAAQSHQDVPFEQLVERIKAPRSTAHSPVFQIMLTTTSDFALAADDSHKGFNLPGVELAPFQSDVVQAKFDLTVDLSISDKGVGLSWTYDVSLFAPQYIEQLNAHLCRLLEGLAEAKGLGDVSILSSAEREHLLYTLNDNGLEYDQSLCIHQFFERQVKANPHQCAVVFENQSLSYFELNAKANRLAHYLKEHHHIVPDKVVGVCVERSIEMVVGILAILKAGGAYVPLDPNYPQDRLSYMVENAELEVVLSQRQVQGVLTGFGGTILTLDGIAGEDHWSAQYPKDNIAAEHTMVRPDHLAYVIYTSGSTGQPKGVMIEHRNTVAMLNWGLNVYSQEELAVVLASTSLNFDLSVYELFLPLSAGTTLRVVRNVLDLIDSPYVGDISLVNTVPSAMDALLKMQALPSSVKVVNLAGEALRGSLVNGLLEQYPQLAVCNLYGPSEDTTYSTYARFEQHLDDAPHIGKVIANSSGYILDGEQQLVPFGVAGELYLGGDGISRGYMNRAELTAERYIDNPFYQPNKAASPKRLYRTGDLVRYLPDGNLAFIGRIDHQVKIRGFRIELGEVEAKLGALECVDSALVMDKTIQQVQELVAYVKPKQAIDTEQQADLVASIKAQLALSLPEYMVPGIIMVIDQWPLTPNGKTDRKALPAPDGSALTQAFEAPVNDTERALLAIWAELLGLDAARISTSANFFDLGGHSLLSVKLLCKVHQTFAKPCRLAQLFSHTTIKAQAIMLEKMDSGLDNTPLLNRLHPVDGAVDAVVFIPGVASDERDFSEIIGQLSQSRKGQLEIGVLRHQGLIAGEQGFATIAQNVAAFVKALEPLSSKSLTLVGHSYGGALALALADALQSKGVQLRLVLLDTYFEQQQLTAAGDGHRAMAQKLAAIDLELHLLELYRHQVELFAGFKPVLTAPVAITQVFALQSPYDLSGYMDYIEQQLPGVSRDCHQVQGDHFTMLTGNSAETISAIINKGISQ